MDSVLRHRGQVITASGLDVLAGIWLIISPFVLGFQDIRNATSNDVIFGIIIVILAAIRFFGAYAVSSLSWIVALIGLWILVSPWVLAYFVNGTPLWNNIITGIVIIVLACWGAIATATEHHYPTNPPMPQV